MESGCFCCCELLDATFPSRRSPALLLRGQAAGKVEENQTSVEVFSGGSCF